jgi:hypothetical protein
VLFKTWMESETKWSRNWMVKIVVVLHFKRQGANTRSGSQVQKWISALVNWRPRLEWANNEIHLSFNKLCVCVCLVLGLRLRLGFRLKVRFRVKVRGRFGRG